jgi:hypothetical protein
MFRTDLIQEDWLNSILIPKPVFVKAKPTGETRQTAENAAKRN